MNSLMRIEPSRGLRRELDRLFDDFLPALSAAPAAGWNPALDISETDAAYIARFDLPGLALEDLQVEVENGMLTVRGERAHSESEASEGLLRSERSFGTFVRSVRLPRETDSEAIEAAFENGVLTVHVPKTEASRPRQIEVRQQKAVGSGDGSREPAPEVG